MDVRPIRPDELEAARQLLRAAGWQRRDVEPDRFPLLVARSTHAFVAVEDGVVIGFIRTLCDGISNGYISMLVVAPAQRRKGVGRALVREVMGDDPHITWVLRAGRDGVAEFYRKLGFVHSEVAMERPRGATNA